jgi:hypothetical protein
MTRSPDGSSVISAARVVRVVLGVAASALFGLPVVILTPSFVDLAMSSPVLFRPMVDNFESPGWARVTAMFWSSAALAGVLIGGLPALLITRSRKWPEVKRLGAVVLSGGLAGAAVILSMQGGLSMAAGASATAAMMSYIFWLVAGR